MSEVEELLDQEYPESWIPEKEGDQIAGTLVRYESGVTKDWGEQIIAVVADSDGALHSVWLLGTVLKSQFAKHRPKPGQKIGIRYLGKKPSATKGQSAYKDFRVVTDGGGFVPDFAALAGEAVDESDDLNPFPPDGAAA